MAPGTTPYYIPKIDRAANPQARISSTAAITTVHVAIVVALDSCFTALAFVYRCY